MHVQISMEKLTSQSGYSNQFHFWDHTGSEEAFKMIWKRNYCPFHPSKNLQEYKTSRIKSKPLSFS
jgi:hypothetical protein